MRITLNSHGGWSGLVTKPITIDTAALPAAAAHEAERLAAAAQSTPGTSPAALTAARGRAPESMSYTITIEDGGRTTTLKSSDAEAHPEIEALAAWVRSQAGK